MAIAYSIVGLRLLDGGNVQVDLRATGPLGGSATVIVPAGSPAIASLTIGRVVDAVYTAA